MFTSCLLHFHTSSHEINYIILNTIRVKYHQWFYRVSHQTFTDLVCQFNFFQTRTIVLYSLHPPSQMTLSLILEQVYSAGDSSSTYTSPAVKISRNCFADWLYSCLSLSLFIDNVWWVSSLVSFTVVSRVLYVHSGSAWLDDHLFW
jgi:hypothetical protein